MMSIDQSECAAPANAVAAVKGAAESRAPATTRAPGHDLTRTGILPQLCITPAQVWKMTALPFGSLPIWKQILYVAVVVAIVYLVYRIASDLWEALQKVFSAIVGLIVAIFNQLKPVVIAGAIAFGGAWMIINLEAPWIP